MREPIITFEREVILRKVLKVPDARYKSGYREVRTLAETRVFIPKHSEGADLTQTHVYSDKRCSTITEAVSRVVFTLTIREDQL